MTTGSSSRRLVIAVLALLPAVAGCSTTPPPRLFTLAPRPGVPDDRFSGTISVKRAELATYLDRPQIVRYSDAYELSLSEYVRWGEGLGDMVTRVLVENLSQRLPRGQVYAASGPLTMPPPDVTLEVDIEKFETDPSGAVVLVAKWLGHRERRGDQLRSSRIRVATSSADAASEVAAMSDALGQLANEIAVGISA